MQGTKQSARDSVKNSINGDYMRLSLYELSFGTHITLLAQVEVIISSLRVSSESLPVKAKFPIQVSLIVKSKLAIEK